jgi:hypothetical protein
VTLASKALRIAVFALAGLALAPPAAAQTAEGQSCAGTMTEQLRRFSEQCLADLVAFVAAQPKAKARILSEADKSFIQLTRTPQGIEAEAASKVNFPLMKPGTEEALKNLGWQPPDNEAGGYKKRFTTNPGASAATADDLAKAFAAYGLARGAAISLTVGTQD